MTAPARIRTSLHFWLVCITAAALGLGACASSGGTRAARSRSQSDVITAEEMQTRQATNAFDLIQEMRSNWLHIRGRDTLSEQGEVVVMLDGMRLGGIETLRHVPVANMVSIRFFSAIDASARWGLEYGHGVIALTSRAG